MPKASGARPVQPAQPPRAPSVRAERAILAGLIAIAAVLMLWRLDANYLWQDEAATAVLSQRMLEHGKPLAWDGVNLITNDNFTSEEFATIDQRTRSADVAVEHYKARGDFKDDTAWTFQPWGQFVMTAASLGVLGHTTFAARLPFALAGIAAVVLFYVLARKYVGDPFVAVLAAGVLVLNAYWILHARQCRYYAPSSLLLVVTCLCYARWQWSGARFGAALFVLAAWCWFQVDYGTLWPVLAVLFADALWHRRRGGIVEPLIAGACLAAAIAPFVFYYELAGRLSVQSRTFGARFQANLFNLNQYVVPAVVVVAAAVLLVRLRGKLPETERRLVTIACAVLGALVLWVPAVAPEGFLRYVLTAAPFGALLTAWVAVRGLGRFGRAAVVGGAAVVVITPSISAVLRPVVHAQLWTKPDTIVRAELFDMASEIFRERPDPNRIVVEWLKANARPTDEILVNYEDIPLMFYLPNPIRGGIAAFRAEDDSVGPPRFLVARQSVPFVHWKVFQRVVDRHLWKTIPVQAPDVMWGNNPDPMGRFADPARAKPLLFAERESERRP